MSIYVEIRVRGSMDELWRQTQDPSLHERWDLRFSEIVYLPRPDETAPQRFSYATRIGFGLRIRGEGESVGQPRRRRRRARLGAQVLVAGREVAHPRGQRATGATCRRRTASASSPGTTTAPASARSGRLLDAAGLPAAHGLGDRLELRPAAALDRAGHRSRRSSASEPRSTRVARLVLAFVFAVPRPGPQAARTGTRTSWRCSATPACPPQRRTGARRPSASARSRSPASCSRPGSARWPFVAAVVLMLGRPRRRRADSSPGILGAAFNPVTLNLAVAALARRSAGSPARRPAVGRALPAARAAGGRRRDLHLPAGARRRLRRGCIRRSSGASGSAARTRVAAIGTRRHGRALARAATRCRSCTSARGGGSCSRSRAANVPFTIENYAYRDGFGRETVTWIRTFATRRPPPVRRLHDLQPRRAAGSSTTSARTSTWRSTRAVRRRARRAAAPLRRAAILRGAGGLHVSRCSSPASPTCASGTTTRPGDSASRSRSATGAGARSSGTAASFDVEWRELPPGSTPAAFGRRARSGGSRPAKHGGSLMPRKTRSRAAA